VYGLIDYGEMLRDQVRVRAYIGALRQVVPGKTVLEIGGGTGFFACVASKLGAAQVTSIDLNPLIQLGPRTARANGTGNIHFIWGRSQDYQPEDLADVLLHDLRGNTPYFDDSLATLRDARRLLKPDAILLPRRDVVYACLVQDPAVYADMEGIWGGRLEGIDLSLFRAETHRLLRYSPGPDSRPWARQRLVEIDYGNISDTALQTRFSQTAEFSGLCHGLAVWFETSLTEQIGFSTDPWLPADQRGTTYGVSFLPWPTPVKLSQGQDYSVEVGISAGGHYTGRLWHEQGGFRRQLGHFASDSDRGWSSLLPLGAKFERTPNAKSYRSALQAIEKGLSVEGALAQIRRDGPTIRSEQTAIGVLAAGVRLVQGTLKRKPGQVLRLVFADLALELRTWDRDLREAVLGHLAPSWKKARKSERPAASLALWRAAHSSGLVLVVEFEGLQATFPDLSEALRHIASLVTEVLLPQSRSCVVLECGHAVSPEGATLILGDHAPSRRGPGEIPEMTMLDRNRRLVPYATAGAEPGPASRIRAVRLPPPGPASRALALTALVGLCRSNRALGNPLNFFDNLLQEARVEVAEGQSI
jgi:protein arginine N-methyltransferase 1